MRTNWWMIGAICCGMIACLKINVARAQETDEMTDNRPAASENWPLNVSLKTLGGKQFWSDHVHFHGHRIQRNVATGHFRLLDQKNVRRAWGNFDQCRQALENIARRDQLQPMTGQVLIVMHGLTRTRSAMKPLSKYIEDNSDLTVLNVSYASTRQSIAQHAEALQQIIEHLPQVSEISFLGHSMGSIVVRYYLQMLHEQGKTDPRFRRMVMLAPPNRGSQFARRLQDYGVYKSLWGVGGQEMSRGWQEIQQKLATPHFEFGIIAGAQDDGSTMNNFLIEGRDDFVVGVEETKLGGAHDFLVRPLIHSTIMYDANVHSAALSFLQHGYFVSEHQRRPIPDNLPAIADSDSTESSQSHR